MLISKLTRIIGYVLILLPIAIVIVTITPSLWQHYKNKLHQEKIVDVTKNGVVFTAKLNSWPTSDQNYCIPLYNDYNNICVLLDSALYNQNKCILTMGYKMVHINDSNDINSAKLMTYSTADLIKKYGSPYMPKWLLNLVWNF